LIGVARADKSEEAFRTELKSGLRHFAIPGPAPGVHETRFHITSLVWIAPQIGPAIRAHWMIENGLHWVLDMNFRDDECRIRTDHAPANFTTIKHMALNLIRRAPTSQASSGWLPDVWYLAAPRHFEADDGDPGR
jgi:hypothetical protein